VDGIDWHGGWDGTDMWGPACQCQGREKAVSWKAQLRTKNVLLGIRQGIQADWDG
jgi:hypothetical protein